MTRCLQLVSLALAGLAVCVCVVLGAVVALVAAFGAATFGGLRAAGAEMRFRPGVTPRRAAISHRFAG